MNEAKIAVAVGTAANCRYGPGRGCAMQLTLGAFEAIEIYERANKNGNLGCLTGL